MDENIIYKSNNSDVLVISFGGFALRMGMPMFEFNSTIDSLDVDSLFLKDTKRVWYQAGISEKHPDVESTLTLLRHYTQKYKKVICIGNSAGAFAAIMFGAMLNADQVVAFAPQTLLKGKFNMDDWIEQFEEMNNYPIFCNDLKHHLIDIEYDTKIDICVPSLNKVDVTHTKHLEGLFNVNIIPFKTKEHNMALFIKNTIGLDRFLKKYIQSVEFTSTYSDFIKLIHNKGYNRIVISGPQRSGTTYLAKELANDIQYKHIDEKDFGFHSVRKFTTFLNNERVVIQAPAVTHILQAIDTENTLVVFMMRPDKDIIKSEDRIDWHNTQSIYEFKKYKNYFVNYTDKINEFKRSSPMKKWFWQNIQKSRMKVDHIELPYDIVKQTKNYVDPEGRKQFGAKQIN